VSEELYSALAIFQGESDACDLRHNDFDTRCADDLFFLQVRVTPNSTRVPGGISGPVFDLFSRIRSSVGETINCR
jgi:hypothetical protein